MAARRDKLFLRLTPDGTVYLSPDLARKSGFVHAKTMSVFYSEPERTLVLMPMPCGAPVLQVSDGAVLARAAAEFLAPLGVLPSEPQTIEARFGPNIVIAEFRHTTPATVIRRNKP